MVSKHCENQATVSYLSCDVPSLIASSSTCTRCTPLLCAISTTPSELGLLPLVKRFRSCSPVPQSPYEFTPKLLDGWTFRYFSALTNLWELGTDRSTSPASCQILNCTLDTSRRPFDSSLSENPKDLAARSCISSAFSEFSRPQALLPVPRRGRGNYN